MSKERRRHVRVTVEIDVEISVQINRKHMGLVTDITEAGLFVETTKHVEEGDFIVIKFSGKKIMFGATVCRVVTGKGFGAKFGSMNEAHREAISKYRSPKTEQVNVSSVSQQPTMMLLCDSGSHSLLSRELKEAGFGVVEVGSTDKVFPSMERFDVVGVVSESVVGGKDTLLILEKIKKEKKQLNFPVILYSSRYDFPHKKIEELGIQCFFKYNTTAGNLASQIKRSYSKDDK